LFDQLATIIASDSSIVSKVGSVFVYNIKSGSQIKTWTVDLKNGKGSVYAGEAKGPVDTTFSLDDEDFVKMIEQKANPQQLFMSGKLKLKGKLDKAMTFEKVLKGFAPKSKL